MNKYIPSLTIAMPVYNGGKLLILSVASIINQTYKDWELLLIDDGSTDNSLQSLQFLSDHRIKIIQDGENKGLAKRLNEAIELTQSKYFARMDQDDISHPERFSEQILYMESNHDIDLLGTSCVTINEKNMVIGVLPLASSHNELCSTPWRGFYLPHPTWLGKTTWFKNNQYKIPGPYCCEDQELLLRTHATSKFHTLPENLLAYRLRNNTSWKKMWFTRIALFNEQRKYCMPRKKYVILFKSFLILMARITYDFLKKITVNERPLMLKKISNDDKKAWVEIINGIKDYSVIMKNKN
jgi:glycosyltransferase involved in cell wall biosynthesis